jgi:TPP-dependent pyruvate/acetoin dehydrogenase alpha subunit
MAGINRAEDRQFVKDEVIADYRLGWLSRHTSLIGRREVLSGRAKFGIFGAGKELPQLALAKVFQAGDFRSGYYRDQTLLFAIGQLTVSQFFAQLYADSNLDHDPASGGRQMNAHFATRLLDQEGNWLELTKLKNSSGDVSPTASQMPRLVGLAYASKMYRQLPQLAKFRQFSNHGQEIAFGTIGNASAAEGMFWESLNAISVLQSPAIVSIWDDNYGISVSNQYQFGKDMSDLLRGFSRKEGEEFGYNFYRVAGWDYPALIDVYQQAAKQAREDHIPAIVHVVELTQPQGHSTSGSHERYKTPERLEWEDHYDCLQKFRQWILSEGLAQPDQLDEIERQTRL